MVGDGKSSHLAGTKVTCKEGQEASNRVAEARAQRTEWGIGLRFGPNGQADDTQSPGAAPAVLYPALAVPSQGAARLDGRELTQISRLGRDAYDK